LKNLDNENEKKREERKCTSLQMGKEAALKTWNGIRKQKVSE